MDVWYDRKWIIIKHFGRLIRQSKDHKVPFLEFLRLSCISNPHQWEFNIDCLFAHRQSNKKASYRLFLDVWLITFYNDKMFKMATDSRITRLFLHVWKRIFREQEVGNAKNPSSISLWLATEQIANWCSVGAWRSSTQAITWNGF